MRTEITPTVDRLKTIEPWLRARGVLSAIYQLGCSLGKADGGESAPMPIDESFADRNNLLESAPKKLKTTVEKTNLNLNPNRKCEDCDEVSSTIRFPKRSYPNHCALGRRVPGEHRDNEQPFGVDPLGQLSSLQFSTSTL